MDPEVSQWADAWRSARALTYDFLRSLPYAIMNFSPHPGFGTLARQIRHVGEIQACYLEGITSAQMDLASRRRQRALEQSKERLEAYLQEQDAALLGLLPRADPARSIKWSSGPVTLMVHLLRLLQHETLHHGMWIFYAKIAELDLPQSWRDAYNLE
ncbi:MAG TPA: DinB family protein [bacterium]|nr:DinB family protein [bacterium]